MIATLILTYALLALFCVCFGTITQRADAVQEHPSDSLRQSDGAAESFVSFHSPEQ